MGVVKVYFHQDAKIRKRRSRTKICHFGFLLQEDWSPLVAGNAVVAEEGGWGGGGGLGDLEYPQYRQRGGGAQPLLS